MRPVAGPDAIGRDAWNGLARRSPTRTVFQSFEWCRAWWETFGPRHESLILAVERGDELLGLAPLVMEGRRVRFLGHGHADYLDFLTVGERPEIAGTVLDHLLAEQRRWDEFVIEQVPADSPHLAALRSRCCELRLPWIEWPAAPCPAVRRPPESTFAREATPPKGTRSAANWFRKQPSFRVRHAHHAADIAPRLPEFFDLHIARWAGTGTPSRFHDPAEREFYRRMVEELSAWGSLLFSWLELEGRMRAAHLGFVQGGSLLYYKPVYDPAFSKRSPGSVLLHELFDLADAERLATFDFSVGDESYKQRYANETRWNTGLTIYRRRIDWLRAQGVQSLKALVKRSRLGRWAIGCLRREPQARRTGGQAIAG